MQVSLTKREGRDPAQSKIVHSENTKGAHVLRHCPEPVHATPRRDYLKHPLSTTALEHTRPSPYFLTFVFKLKIMLPTSKLRYLPPSFSPSFSSTSFVSSSVFPSPTVKIQTNPSSDLNISPPLSIQHTCRHSFASPVTKIQPLYN